MSYTTELIDRFKAARGFDSDYAAAKALGLRPNRLSNYRCDVSHADDKTAVMLADALGLDRLETIARINMDRATDKADKEFWRKLAHAAVLAGALLLPTLPIKASPGVTSQKTPDTAYYVRFARWLAQLRRAVKVASISLGRRHDHAAALLA